MFDPEYAYDQLADLVISWFSGGATAGQVSEVLHDFMGDAALVIGGMVQDKPEERNGE